MSDPAVTPAALPPVPVSDPARVMRQRQPEIEAALRDVLLHGHYVLGPQVEQFEREFARWLGTAHTIGVANGTDALELALRGAEIPAGAPVAIPALTASATAAAVVRAGLVPVVLDIDLRTGTLDPQRLRETCQAYRHIHNRPIAAVVPVHLYGLPCDLDRLREVAAEFHLALVEDCAQSHGSSLHGRKTGTFGTTAAFSCYPTKSLPALGDAGLVVTHDAATAGRIRELRQYGWKRRHFSEEVGLNSRLDELQAAVLRVHLAHLDADNARRGAIGERYDAAFADLPLSRPVPLPDTHVCHHQYVIFERRRDALQAHLAGAGIQSSILYPVPIHEQPVYARMAQHPGHDLPPPECPAARQACQSLLCLPLHPLLSQAEVSRVIAAVRGFYLGPSGV